MEARDSRKCKICGASYNYCPYCQKYNYLPSWMNLFCGDECHEAYEALNDYAFGHISKDIAAEKLKNFSKNIIGNFKSAYNEIMSSNEKQKDCETVIIN